RRRPRAVHPGGPAGLRRRLRPRRHPHARGHGRCLPQRGSPVVRRARRPRAADLRGPDRGGLPRPDGGDQPGHLLTGTGLSARHRRRIRRGRLAGLLARPRCQRSQGRRLLVRRLLRRLLRLRGGGRAPDRALLRLLTRGGGPRVRRRAPHRCAAVHLLPAGRVRRCPRGCRESPGGARLRGLLGLHAGPGGHPRPDVHVPRRRLGRPAAGLAAARAAGRGTPRRRPGHGRRQPRGLDRRVAGDRGRLMAVVTGRPLPDRTFFRGGAAALLWVGAAAVPLVFLGTFFAWPVLTLLARGVMTDGALDLSGFADVLSRDRTWRVIGMTLAQSAVGTAAAVVLGVPGAYVLYRCRFRGQGLVRAFVTVPFVLPTVVVGVAFRALLTDGGPLGFLGLDGTFTAVVLALVFFNYAVVVRTVGALWARLDPRLEQAARALGAGPVRAFVTVTLPALGPAIASAASVVFLFCATAFGVVMVLGGVDYGTVETEIWVQTTQFLDLRAAAVLSVVQVAVVTLALAAATASRRRQERALRLQTDSLVRQPLRLRPGADLLPAVVTAAVVLGLLVTPLAGLLVRSLRTPAGWSLDNYIALGTTGGANALTVTVWEATANSLRAAVDATVLAV